MRHHIILISLDALRADRLWCLGASRYCMKYIESLLPEAVLFSNVLTPATWTLPAHMSMLSGLDPLVHGCISPNRLYPPDTLPFPQVFEMFERDGYMTHGMVGGGYMDRRFGLGHGASSYRLVYLLNEAVEAVIEHVAHHPRTFSLLHTFWVHDWARLSYQDNPLRYVMLSDPGYQGSFPREEDFADLLHDLQRTADPFSLSIRDLAYLNELYNAATENADGQVGRLFRILRDNDAWDHTTLVITSDHGESLGEQHAGRHHLCHGNAPYQEQLRVPLIIRPAAHLRSRLPAGVVKAPVSLVDLVPTLLELTGLPYEPDQFTGRSLVRLCRGEDESLGKRTFFAHACADKENQHLLQHLEGTALIRPDGTKAFFGMRTRRCREIYNLVQDPGERCDLLGEINQFEVGLLEKEHEDYFEAMKKRAYNPPEVAFDSPEILIRLRELGYL